MNHHTFSAAQNKPYLFLFEFPICSIVKWKVTGWLYCINFISWCKPSQLFCDRIWFPVHLSFTLILNSLRYLSCSLPPPTLSQRLELRNTYFILLLFPVSSLYFFSLSLFFQIIVIVIILLFCFANCAAYAWVLCRYSCFSKK